MTPLDKVTYNMSLIFKSLGKFLYFLNLNDQVILGGKIPGS